MKFGKIKKVVRQHQSCLIAETNGVNNMITQWMGCASAMYPVREMRVDYDMLRVIWDYKPDEWALIASPNILPGDPLFEHLPAEIDTKTAPDHFIAKINGYLVYGDELDAGGCELWAVDEDLLEPCKDSKKPLHLIRQKHNAAVYCGGQLAGVVATANDENVAWLITMCERIAQMEVAL